MSINTKVTYYVRTPRCVKPALCNSAQTVEPENILPHNGIVVRPLTVYLPIEANSLFKLRISRLPRLRDHTDFLKNLPRTEVDPNKYRATLRYMIDHV